VFSGCLPFFSPEEKRQIAQRSGGRQYVDMFFRTGPVAEAAKDAELYRVRLSQAVKAALRADALTSERMPRTGGDLAGNSLVSSLKQGLPINYYFGIPRLIIYSDMGRFMGGLPGDRAQARSFAISKAQSADLNLMNSEVYLSGTTARAFSKEALEAFFLASHGELISVGSVTGTPTFGPAPVRVSYYQGLVQFPDNQFAIRIRLATDQSGNVVNSWVLMRTNRDHFVPFHGVVTCQGGQPCIYTGDETFSQLWNVQRNEGASPRFDQKLPFYGARSFKFSYNSRELSGEISDPMIIFPGVKEYKLRFKASPTNGRF
jgi:hypothetical protein